MCLAIPGEIVEISENTPMRMAKVNFGGAVKSDISLLFCPLAKINDYCLVHAGIALEVIKEDRAREALFLYR